MVVATTHGISTRNFASLNGDDAEHEFTAHPGLRTAFEFYLAKDWQTAEDTWSSTVETSFDFNIDYCHDSGLSRGIIMRVAWGEDGAPTWATYGETLTLLNRDNHTEETIPAVDDPYLQKLWRLYLYKHREFLEGTCPGGGHTRVEHYTGFGCGIGGNESPEMSTGYSNTYIGDTQYLGSATLSSGISDSQTTLTLAGAYSTYPTGACTLVIDWGGKKEFVHQLSRSGATVTIDYTSGTGSGRGHCNSTAQSHVSAKVVQYLPTTYSQTTTYKGNSGEFDEWATNENEWLSLDTEANWQARIREVWRESEKQSQAIIGSLERSDGTHPVITFQFGGLFGNHTFAQDLCEGDTAWDGTGLFEQFGNRCAGMVTAYNAYVSDGDTFRNESFNLWSNLMRTQRHGGKVWAQNKGRTAFPSSGNDENLNDYILAGETSIIDHPMTILEPQPQRYDESATLTSSAEGDYAGYTSDNVKKYLGGDSWSSPARSDNLNARLYGDLEITEDFSGISDETTITTANCEADAVTTAGGSITADTAQPLWGTVAARFDVDAAAGDLQLQYNIDSRFAYVDVPWRWDSFDTGSSTPKIMRFRYTSGNVAFIGYNTSMKPTIMNSSGTVVDTGTITLAVDTDYIFRVYNKAGGSSEGETVVSILTDPDDPAPADVLELTGQSYASETMTRVDLGTPGKGAPAVAHMFWVGEPQITDHGWDVFRWGDPAAPVIDMTTPEASDTVSGTKELRAKCFDVISAQADLTVEFQIDSSSWVTATWDATNEWHDYQWNTTLETDASHTVKVRATDEASHVTTGDAVTVTVLNGSTRYGAADLSGSGSLAASGFLSSDLRGAADLTGSGSLSASGVLRTAHDTFNLDLGGQNSDDMVPFRLIPDKNRRFWSRWQEMYRPYMVIATYSDGAWTVTPPPGVTSYTVDDVNAAGGHIWASGAVHVVNEENRLSEALDTAGYDVTYD